MNSMFNNVFGDFENRAQQRQKQKAEIDALLESETTTVGDLFSMDNQEKQDEIMSQLRWGNKKVLNFFNEKRCFELIQYLIEMPPQDCTHDRGHKFPFLANQVFIDGGEGAVPIIEQFFYSNAAPRDDEKKKNEKWEIEQIIKQGFKKISQSKKQISEVKLKETINNGRTSDLMPTQVINDVNSDEDDDFKVVMNNVQGSIEQDSSDEEIRPANLSDEFEEVGMVIPIDDDADQNEEEFDKVEKAGIMDNIANMVDMLNNKNTDQKYEQMMTKLENPNVKKSFETKVENDDDDEIFIVHEEEDENQDSLFAEGAFQSFNEGDAAEPVMAKTTSTESAENPFTDNLANSVALPQTQKLDVQIDENYLAGNMHIEKQQKRKDSRNRAQNISIHQFDAKTQQSIQDTVELERQKILNEDAALSRSVGGPQLSQTLIPEEKKEEKPSAPRDFNLATSVMLVEDHVVKQKSPPPAAAETSPAVKDAASAADVDVVPSSPEKDDLNDRAGEDDEIIEIVQDIHDEEESMSLTLKLKEFELQEQEEVDNEVEVEDDDDNILRKSSPGNAAPSSTEAVPKYEFQEIDDHQEEQLSIEIVEKEEENTRKQDYKLITAFFAFIDVEPRPDENGDTLNPTLCGYFCKVLQVMIQHQPQEINKYIQSTDYKVLDKLMKFIDNESICEIFIKLLNTISDQSNQSLPVGIVNVQNSLQQSGQSSESNPKHSPEDAPNPVQKKIQEIALNLLENCLNDDSDVLMKMGAIEVLESLLQKKWCYQVLTTKKSFEIMTIRLVSDFEETKKFMYILMKNLVDFYEKHEGLIKRLNFDNFEDDDLMNSHSGSFMDGKKSKNSKKQNQEVFKDIQESDLFHFFKAVINEISAAEIEQKSEEISEGKGKRLGSYFMAVIEFLEVASTTFSGFKFDLNHVIIEKELFIYLFDICEYFPNSDCLIQKVFKIIGNIFKARNEDVSEMVRYLLEDTQLIPFLIKHGPRVTIQEDAGKAEEQNAKSPEKKKDHNGTKSPEQSGEFLQESSTIKVSKKKVQLQCQNPSGLQSQCKLIANIINDFYKKDKKEKSLDKLKNFNSNSGIHNSGQQSGEQSKSSLIEIEPTDEEQQIQRVSKVIVSKLRDNEEWMAYCQTCIEPIIELEKGKLCQNDETGSERDSSHGNLFDDDFMRSDFAENGDSANQDDNQDKDNGDDAKDGDEEDHQKFFKKMQQCFSSNKAIGSKNKSGIDYIDENERESKASAMSMQSEVNGNLRASLSDLANFSPKDSLGGDGLELEKRERSCSKDKFDLPPLPDLDDNKDLMELDDPDTRDFKNDNYRSNDAFSHLAAIAESDNDDFLKDEMNQDLDELKGTDFNEDIKNEGLDTGNLNNLSDDDDFHIDQDKLLNFDSNEILNEVRSAVQEEQMFSNLKAHSQNMEDKQEDEKLQFDEFQEFNSIFDRIADLDKYISDDSDDDNFGLDRAIGQIDVDSPTEPDHNKKLSKPEEGISQSIDEIMNDFPGVVVKQNNFMKGLELDLGDEPQEQLLTTPRVKDHKSISKSEYIPSKTISLTNPDQQYQDNVYWDLKDSLIVNYKLEDLLQDYD